MCVDVELDAKKNNLYDDLLDTVLPVLIGEVFIGTGYNQTETAKKLGINRRTCKKLMDKYHICTPVRTN